MRDPNLLYLLLFDLLYGKGIQGGGQVKRLLLTHEAALRAAAEGVEAPPPQTPGAGSGFGDAGEDGNGGGGRFPRYARVNPLKLTVAAAVAALAGETQGKGKGDGGGKEGAERPAVVVIAREDIQVGLVACVSAFGDRGLTTSLESHTQPHHPPKPHNPTLKQEDPHIPGLLALPPGTDLHAHPLVLSGALVLQDKASCFSAQALLGDVLEAAAAAAAPAAEGGKKGDRPLPVCGDVIDACAAPGMFVVLWCRCLHRCF